MPKKNSGNTGYLTVFVRYVLSFQPRAGVRVQLIAASLMWLIGSSILLIRGAGYIYDRHWHAWALGAGLVLGALKSRALLDRAAKKAVKRIYQRGSAGFFGFFSAKSWALIVVMMGSGMVLRRIVVQPGVIGAGIMGAIYIGAGTALLIADRIFWHAAIFNQKPDLQGAVKE